MHVDAAVETEGIRLWMPVPRDPLSDYVGLPLISIPQQIIHELSIETAAHDHAHAQCLQGYSMPCPNSVPIPTFKEDRLEDS